MGLCGAAGNEQDLGDDDESKAHVDGHGGDKDLDVELDEADPRGAGKGLPGVLDGDVAGAADDGGLELALEGAVKGHNGLVLLGQEGGLGAGQDDVGRDGDEDGEGNGDEEDEEALPRVAGRGLRHLGRVRRVVGGHAQDTDQELGNPRVDLQGQEVDDGGQSASLECLLEGRQTLVEALLRGVRDDNVQPGAVELNEGDCGDHGGHDGGNERQGADDAIDKHGGDGQGGPAGETTEVRLPARDAGHGAVEAAEAGANGAGVLTTAGGLVGNGGIVLGQGVGIGVERDGLVGGRRRILNHGDDGEDILKGVADDEDKGQKDDDINQRNTKCPAGQLIDGIVLDGTFVDVRSNVPIHVWSV